MRSVPCCGHLFRNRIDFSIFFYFNWMLLNANYTICIHIHLLEISRIRRNSLNTSIGIPMNISNSIELPHINHQFHCANSAIQRIEPNKVCLCFFVSAESSSMTKVFHHICHWTHHCSILSETTSPMQKLDGRQKKKMLLEFFFVFHLINCWLVSSGMFWLLLFSISTMWSRVHCVNGYRFLSIAIAIGSYSL